MTQKPELASRIAPAGQARVPPGSVPPPPEPPGPSRSPIAAAAGHRSRCREQTASADPDAGVADDDVEQRGAADEGEEPDVQGALREAGGVPDLLVDADVDDLAERPEGGRRAAGRAGRP